MKNKYPLLLLILILLVPWSKSHAQKMWHDVSVQDLQRNDNSLNAGPVAFRSLSLDIDALKATLKNAPVSRESSFVLEFPLPTGEFEKFSVFEASIMAPELAAKFPEIKTYAGQGIDDPTSTLRFDVTPKGLHAVIFSAKGSVYIDPLNGDNIELYQSYFKKDFVTNGSKTFTEFAPLDAGYRPATNKGSTGSARASDGNLRTYRAAVSCTGEYAGFHGGTVTAAMAAIVTTMNRVTGIYEREVAVSFVLVANNDQIVYTNAATDPYTNNSAGALIGQSQSNIDGVIGSANYDIGHTFSTGAGGLASLGVVCTGGLKARGVTGTSSPTGDPFDVDFVAHEIGHQFGGNHTFNGSSGNCSGGNRNASTAYEVGSGTTIQAYAGICTPQNIQNNSDDYFHAISLDEIINYITTGGNGCPTVTPIAGSIPTVDAGADFTIPISTPFTLTGTASDADGDAITYCWEEFDLGPQGAPDISTNTTAPIFRSFAPTTDPSRTFPQISDIVNNTQTLGEILPSVARTMNFRLTVRDNRAGGGSVNDDAVVITVSSSAGPFEVSSPNTNVTWSSGTSQTVTWDVAGTDGSPVNAANVNILLSTDGGLTYPTTLASGVANDGSESITVPALATSTARVKVEAAGNVFYDVSNADFTIESTGPCTVSVPSGLASSGVTSSSANISWDSQASATSYDYQYREVGAASWTVVNTASTSATVSGLSSLTDYEFQVRAICPDETSAYSASSNFTTLDVDPPCTVSVPTGLTSSGVTSSGADISWDSQASATSYDYQYRATGAASWTAVNTTATSASISGLAADTEYEFQVRAICPDQTSAYSASSNFTTDQVGGASCDVAPALSASGITESSATISWPAIDGVTNHSYRYRLATGGSWTTGSTTASSVTISGLSADTEYEFRMRASCTTGNSPLGSINFTTTDGGTPTCDVPSGLASSSVGETTATISWGAVSIANTYDVRYRETGAASWIDLSVSGTSTSLSGLTADTDYEYQVQSNCTGEVSGYSASSNFTTTDGGGGGTSCDIAPQNLSASTTATTATISWSAVDGANSYTYKNRRTTGGGATNGTVTSNSVTLTGLIANATYTFNLRTSCDSGNSPAGSFTYTTGASRANASASRGGVSDIKFYPNPAENVLKVDLPFAEGSGNVKIFDMKGVMLKNAVLNVNTNEIDLSGMERGVYLINITTENTSLTKRFVKN